MPQALRGLFYEFHKMRTGEMPHLNPSPAL